MNLNKYIDILLGKVSDTPLKYRMAHAAMLINIILATITIPLNYKIKLPFYAFAVLFFTILLFSFLYYLSRFKRKTKQCIDITILYTFLILTPVMWFTNNGINGGFQYYIYLFGAFSLAVVEGKKLLFFLLLLLFVTISLIIISFLHPEFVINYPSKTDQFADMFTSYILVFISILFLMYYYTNQSHKYNKILNETNIKLEKVNSQLSERVKEREILLHEVHHRVKNNLQMISGLLRLQYDTIKDKDISKSLQISQERIDAISIVHELLYKSKNLKYIDIKEYTGNLVTNMRLSSFSDKKNIIIESHMDHSTMVIDKLIPYGLILNELLSNSIKHAFTKKGGKIIIEGKKQDQNYRVSVKDNGKGLPVDFDSKKTDSLGFKLITGLNDQINSNFNINRLEQGVEFIMNFKITS